MYLTNEALKLEREQILIQLPFSLLAILSSDWPTTLMDSQWTRLMTTVFCQINIKHISFQSCEKLINPTANQTFLIYQFDGKPENGKNKPWKPHQRDTSKKRPPTPH